MSNQILSILSLKLENYRNFENFEIETTSGPIILIGENGIGKTNILESISFLVPGKGLRSAKAEDICRNGCDFWNAKFNVLSKLGIATIENKFHNFSKKKITEFNGVKIPSTDLSKLLNVIWLTPQMDSIFLDSPGDRRRFFDRIVYSFFSDHARQMNKYDHFVRERAQVLQQNIMEEDWLDILEAKIASIATKIAISRVEVISKMQNSVNSLTNEFPKSIISIEGELEAKIQLNEKNAAENIVEFVMQKLRDNRKRDQISGRTNFGPHLSDLKVIHQSKNQLAESCSTGEQKAMLISLILAQISTQIEQYKLTPIILLDEVFVHLDNRRKEYLTEFFLSQNMQIWVTNTDLAGIKTLAKKAQIIRF